MKTKELIAVLAVLLLIGSVGCAQLGGLVDKLPNPADLINEVNVGPVGVDLGDIASVSVEITEGLVEASATSDLKVLACQVISKIPKLGDICAEPELVGAVAGSVE